jgi:hypothetical protein
MAKSLLAWHFLRADGQLRYGDSRIPKDREKLTIKGPLLLCINGLHASVNPLDALSYAPGFLLCRVRLSGQILEGNDKACATERTVLWRADATATVVEFAQWCAGRAKKHADAAAADAAERKEQSQWLAKRFAALRPRRRKS